MIVTLVPLVALHSNHHAGKPHWPSLNLTLCCYQMRLYNETYYPPSKAALQKLTLSVRFVLVLNALVTWAVYLTSEERLSAENDLLGLSFGARYFGDMYACPTRSNAWKG